VVPYVAEIRGRIEIMSILNKLFGFRWSLYIVKNGNELVFAMHENSVFRIIGYVQGYFVGDASPKAPWSLHLNFNKTHTSIELTPAYFSNGDLTEDLMSEIERIDPGYRVKGNEPVFIEAATKKQLPIALNLSVAEMIEARRADKPEETTFYTVMDLVFDKE
jgi:hypothetical protein